MSTRPCRCVHAAAAAAAAVAATLFSLLLVVQVCVCVSGEDEEVLEKQQLAEFYSKFGPVRVGSTAAPFTAV